VDENRSGVAVGFTYFAAIMMMLAGAFDILQGLAAIIKKSFYVVSPNYVYKFNVTTWGWINVALGAVILLAGIWLFRASMWARIVGVIVAARVAIGNFMWLPCSPVWSIIVIAACAMVIWALTAHGRDIVAARQEVADVSTPTFPQPVAPPTSATA